MFHIWNKKRGMSGLGALSFTMDKANYYVGDAPTYNIAGGTPFTEVLWSSNKNGVSTGEVLSDYGHRTDGNGNLVTSGGNWTSDQLGAWSKSVNVAGESAAVGFGVTAAPAYVPPINPAYNAPQTAIARANNSSDPDTFNILGYDIPKLVVYAGIGLLAYHFLGKK